MKKQWLLSILFLGFLIIPSGTIIPPQIVEPQLSNSSQVSSTLPRVYGENLAAEIYSKINLTNYKSLVQEFSEIGPRYIMTYSEIPGSSNEEARLWLIDKMSELSNGRIQISVNGTFKNIIGCLPGYLPDKNNELPVFIVCAHYDTMDGSPGANKDGSGIAVLLELLRVMSQYEWPLDILFIAFNGEHALGSLLGSKEISNQFLLNGVKILAMYNVDTILRYNRYAAPDERLLLAYNTGGQYWAELAKTMGNYYSTDMLEILPYTAASWWASSSNYQFSERGYHSILSAYESGYMFDSVSGTSDDVWSQSEFGYFIGRITTGFIGASIAFTLGRAYGQVTTLSATRTLSHGLSTELYIPISIATTLNISCRWYGGGATFSILDPNDTVLNSTVYTDGNPWEARIIFSYPATTTGLYKLKIADPGINSIGFDVNITFDSDVDNDHVKDSTEYWLDTSLFSKDSDNDTISNAMEIILGTNPYSADSDNDLMPDDYELKEGFNPLNASDALADADGDGLTNLQEYQLGTNPHNPDTDGDGMPDGWEVANGLNPLVNDANGNPDHDQYTNLEEYLNGTNPNVSNLKPFPIVWIATPIAAVALIVVGAGILRWKQ